MNVYKIYIYICIDIYIYIHIRQPVAVPLSWLNPILTIKENNQTRTCPLRCARIIDCPPTEIICKLYTQSIKSHTPKVDIYIHTVPAHCIPPNHSYAFREALLAYLGTQRGLKPRPKSLVPFPKSYARTHFPQPCPTNESSTVPRWKTERAAKPKTTLGDFEWEVIFFGVHSIVPEVSDTCLWGFH